MKFELYKDAKGEYRWRLKALNGNIIATSSEGYKTKGDCEHAIKLVQGSGSASVVEV
ncbi:MAG: DUF1508 domain-containing protein [Methylocystis sp.]|nr:DUF1508 domain-containing protein [Methylocystis sp.]